MHRRQFLLQVSLAAAGVSLSSCRKSLTRGEALASLVPHVLAADIAEIGAASRRLDDAVARLVAGPTSATLAEARVAWKGAVTRWKRGYCYRNGPLVETAALLRAAFWPARPPAIDSLLEKPLPEGSFVEGLGVDVKGLYALEYLLFGIDKAPDASPRRFEGTGAERTRVFARALSADVLEWAEKAAGALGDGKKLAQRLADGGQETVNYLVNQMVGTVETVQQRLVQAKELAQNQRLLPKEIEGWPSGTSTDILRTLVTGTEHLYVGGGTGLAALVVDLAPKLDPRFKSAFEGARGALQALGGPVEDAARNAPAALDEAAAAVKALELALKTELASVLGVTLTFTSTDGD